MCRFAVWLGNNDVHNTFLTSTLDNLENDVREYAALLDVLYQTGARNFLILNVPPFDRSPMLAGRDPALIPLMEDTVAAYNKNLTKAIDYFGESHANTTVFQFDAHSLFSEILDWPCSHEATCAVQDTFTFCRAYQHEKENPYRFNRRCQYSLDKYFWLNSLQ